MTRRRLAISATLAAVLVVAMAQAAFAASPPSSAKTIKKVGFESSTDSFSLKASTMANEPTPAYWGRTRKTDRSGYYSLWCAGTLYPSGSWSSFFPTYPKYTRGTATLNLSTTKDYYRSWMSFYYTLPSIGDNDLFTLTWGVPGADVFHEGYRRFSESKTDRPSTWSKRTVELSGGDANISRKSARMTFVFADIQEGAGGRFTGRGPAIDDVSITGYKYGPVRSLTSSYTAGAIRLAWQRPERSVNTTAVEERSITYRVWRRTKISSTSWSSWTEKTSKRTTATAYRDSSITKGKTYEYHVQAWDTGTGSGYGQYKRRIQIAK